MGPTWGPSAADRTQEGPMLAPSTLLSGTSPCAPWVGGSNYLWHIDVLKNDIKSKYIFIFPQPNSVWQEFVNNGNPLSAKPDQMRLHDLTCEMTSDSWRYVGPNNNTWSMAESWWLHQMEILSALLRICAGNSPITGEFTVQRPVTRSFDVFFYLRLNKRSNKQSWGWWFETPSHPLWRNCNDIVDIYPETCMPSVQSHISIASEWQSTHWTPHGMETLSLPWPFMREAHKSLVDPIHKGPDPMALTLRPCAIQIMLHSAIL